MMDKRDASALEDIKVHVRFKLFALWSSVMFFYIYGDYFELFQPGKLQDMLSGRTPLGAMSQGVLLGMSAIMVIPSLMPFLSLVLPAGVNRWVNIVFGAIYSAIMILVIRGGWHYYVFFGLIEITLTVLIMWCAWTWPKQNPLHR
ncbi:MAG TPA: DUF6326 family protein [Candidatus Acidoferrales bacterium]|nr:DUF6326 family protein [Candidatus Acidoferrales bacterium]